MEERQVFSENCKKTYKRSKKKIRISLCIQNIQTYPSKELIKMICMTSIERNSYIRSI